MRRIYLFIVLGITHYTLQAMKEITLELDKAKRNPKLALEILQAAEIKYQNNDEILKLIHEQLKLLYPQITERLAQLRKQLVIIENDIKQLDREIDAHLSTEYTDGHQEYIGLDAWLEGLYMGQHHLEK